MNKELITVTRERVDQCVQMNADVSNGDIFLTVRRLEDLLDQQSLEQKRNGAKILNSGEMYFWLIDKRDELKRVS